MNQLVNRSEPSEIGNLKTKNRHRSLADSAQTSSLGGFLRSLRTIFRATLFAILNTGSIQSATNNVVAHTWQILNPSATNHHDRVFLQIMTDSRNISSYLKPRGEANPSHFTQSGVWLFRCSSVNPCANPTTLRATLQSRGFGFLTRSIALITNELLDGGHFIACAAFDWFQVSTNTYHIKGKGDCQYIFIRSWVKGIG
jgi:hypothetical protein